MKKIIMLVMATITVATFLLINVNEEEKMSDIALANIEALADNELAVKSVIVGLALLSRIP